MDNILVVDDEKNYLLVLRQLLENSGYRVFCAANPNAALKVLEQEQIDLVLSDLKMPQMSGLDFMRRVREEIAPLPFIIITAFATVTTAIEAMKNGACDYLLKPFDNEEILLVIDKALKLQRLQSQNQMLRRQLAHNKHSQIVGESNAIKHLLHQMQQVAPARTSILICGESGTGKELVAQELHRLSPRRDNAMVSVNCAAFAENLLESELFGHERGAFTGATGRKIGLLEAANGGTLFLDEIGEFPLPLQAKLLRVLQDKRFRRVGGVAEIESDVRIIAATNRDLEQMIDAGTFRDDLYYRLNVVTLQVPPLRQRSEDIPLLALLFLRRYARECGRTVDSISAEALQALCTYHWPGNIRELQNVLERGVLFCDGDELLPSHLPLTLIDETDGVDMPTIPVGNGKTLPEILEAVEKNLIEQALRQAAGVQAQAAASLGISRSNLQYKLKKYSLL